MSGNLKSRLVVTGHDEHGRSRVVSDTTVSGHELPGTSGIECSQVWGSDARMHYPDRGEKPGFTEFFPPLDGFRWIETYLPAGASVEADLSHGGESATALDETFSGISETMAEGRPGMHRTPTTDMIVVIEGRCVLQLDEERVELGAGDLLVQSGTIHAWENPYDEPCRFLAAVVGAKNDLCE